MAPKSSITAKAVRKIFNDVGTFFPSNERIPTANAISVAIGIPAPDWVFVPKLITVNSKAGINIPPKAPKIGKAAFFLLESSPL